VIHLLDGASIPRGNPHLDPSVEGHEADIHEPGQPLVAEMLPCLKPPESFDPIHITAVYCLFIKIARVEMKLWVAGKSMGLSRPSQKRGEPRSRASNFRQGIATKTRSSVVK